jgi:aryl-alcohol dehydrogenase-like predicted oxidoreductase
MIEQQPFGRTGHQSSRVIFGGAALGGMSVERSDALLPLLLEHGVNHLDTAASYGDSELRIARWLVEHRRRFFLATKTGSRTADGARAELERSLQRLGVDQVDLIQLHNLVEQDEWEQAHGPGGAVEALVAARDEGLVRFIGVTGHGVRIAGMHRRSLERFPFDSVLFPYNVTMLDNQAYRADVEALIESCVEQGVALQTIKSLARRRWPDGDQRRFSWYEPLTDEGAVARAVRFVLGRPGLFLNTSSDARLLPSVLRIASAGPHQVPSTEELRADVAANEMTPLFDGGELERI